MSAEKNAGSGGFIFKIILFPTSGMVKTGKNMQYFINQFRLYIYCGKSLGELIQDLLLERNWSMTLAER